MKKIFLLLILLVVGAYIYMTVFATPPNPMGMMPGGAMPATVAKVIKEDITVMDEFSGRLTAVDYVQLRPRVAGQIESVHFEDGQQVQKGDLLFIIDPRPFKAAEEAAQARYNLAKAEFDRAAPLLEEKAISQRSFDQRESNLKAARAELTQARLNLEYTRVTAPVSGKVGRREVTAGNLVNVGEPVLTTVVSQHPIYADFEADEQRFLKFTNAAESLEDIPVTLDLASDVLEERTGRIHSFDNQLDTQTGSIRVRAVFDNEDGTLVPGMFARVRIASGDSGPALLVADSAIGTDQDKKFVYVLEDNKPVWREVTLGPAHGRLRVIETGLKEGEIIIVKGLRMLKPGMPVNPTQTSMEQAIAGSGSSTETADMAQSESPEAEAQP